MPWGIKKLGSKYQVVKQDTGKPTGPAYRSRTQAIQYLKALYANTKE